MSRKYTILYIHGMGGGVDSRIPSILNEHINEYVHDPDIRIDIVVRTYDIDPYIAFLAGGVAAAVGDRGVTGFFARDSSAWCSSSFCFSCHRCCTLDGGCQLDAWCVLGYASDFQAGAWGASGSGFLA